ncbi:hypothetical protein [Nonlabens sp.]|uniref:hypothetical protein n=1 Tax=Nonlabens sp. TaxID=1888209 RepID=UPI003F69A427
MNLQLLVTRGLYSLMLLCVSMCGCGDEDMNYLVVEGTVVNATVVENNAAGYQVNDTLFVETSIPFEFMDHPEFNNINQVDGLYNNNPFQFQMFLNRESQFGEDVRINVAPEHIVSTTGETTFDYQSFILQTIEESGAFKHRFGIILKEAGNYRLESYSSHPDYLMSYHMNNYNISLNLYSVLRTGTNAANFSFTVSP